METKIVPFWQVKSNPDNPRFIRDDKFKKLVQSLKDFPEMTQVRELVVNQDMVVIGGNMRLKAMQEAGWTDVPVKVVDWSEEKQREFVIKDNASFGEWDFDALGNMYEPAELDAWGVDLPDFEDIKEVDEDEAPEVNGTEPARSQLGDIYQLGRHRLMCGDSTKQEDVARMMDGKKADITFHSPPYNVGHNLGYKTDSKYQNSNDKLSDTDYLSLLVDTTTNALAVSKYAFINLQFLANNKRVIIDYLSSFRDMFVDIAFWKKSQVQPAMAENVMNSQVECIFVFGGNGSRSIDTGAFRGNVSNFIETDSASGENKNSDIHNATYPVAFPSYFVKNFTEEGDGVVDMFAGSGTTLIVCEQLNRTCYMMELDPKYCDVIRKRYWKLTHDGNEDGWEVGTPVITGDLQE